MREYWARLEVPGADLDKSRKVGASHFFDNGVYTHSELRGEDFFDQIQMPSGIVLCRNPDYQEERTRIEQAGRSTSAAREIEKKYQTLGRRFQPLRVTIDNFELPEDVKKSLQETDEPLVRTLIENYL